MKITHIAFFGVPYTAHTNATLPIVSSLLRRGHRITYVTSELFAPAIRRLGAEVALCKHWAPSESEWDPLPVKHPKINVSDWDMLCPMNLRTLNEVEKRYETDRPDVIIYDLVSFAGRVLAHRWNIPAIQISPHYALDESGITSQIASDDFREHLVERGKNAAHFFQRYGIHDDNWLYHREELNIYSIPRIFQPEGDAKSDDRCFFAGRCVVERTPDGNWQNPRHDGRPIALVTGSMTYVRDPDYFKMCLAALSGLHWHIVLVTGAHNVPTALGRLPPHAELVRHVSNIKVLPHASLLICQGGNMSTTEAGFFGVPVIAATFGFAELEWCAETTIVRLGLGRHLKKDTVDENTIREAAISIAENTDIRRNLDRVSHLIQIDPGAEAVADRIDLYLKISL